MAQWVEKGVTFLLGDQIIMMRITPSSWKKTEKFTDRCNVLMISSNSAIINQDEHSISIAIFIFEHIFSEISNEKACTDGSA